MKALRSAQPSVAPSRFIVFLFDDRHLSATDLEPMKRAAARMLDESLNGSDWATVVTTSGGGSGMTQDHAKLQSAIMNLKAQPRLRQDKTGVPISITTPPIGSSTRNHNECCLCGKPPRKECKYSIPTRMCIKIGV